MRHRRKWGFAGWLALLAVIGGAPARATAGSSEDAGLAALARRAAAGDLEAARSLRAAGPDGLSALADVSVAEPGREGQEGYRQALDVVCAQRGCVSSHLYWYTDFAAAREAAEASGKPIVVLRLLGRLDEELSCANSRYFRLLLYSDPAIAGWLRGHAVLYWSSERPAPRVTIDYGDGRRMVGTVTGNSIHYLLDPHGRLVDALPGLNTPQRFLAWLRSGAEVARGLAPLADREALFRLREAHADAEQRLLTALEDQLVALGWSPAAAREAWESSVAEVPAANAGAAPPASSAALRALSKSVAERPLLTALDTAPPPVPPTAAIDALALAPEWQAELAPASLRLIEEQAPAAARADLAAALQRLRSRLAEDGLRNEALLHRRIHDRLASTRTADWRQLNEWVYRELFLTPASDPWLGLAPSELLGALAPAP